MSGLVLSLFPGIGLLDMAFEEEASRQIAYAWAGGFFDGEGCVSITKSSRHGRPRPYYRVDLIVSNTNKEPLQRFVALFDGRIDAAKRATAKTRAGFQWKTTGTAHAARVLGALRPWLIAKQAQAVVALRACAQFGSLRDQRRQDLDALEAMKQEMHRLNRRGGVT